MIQDVPSANWSSLAEAVAQVAGGDRGYMVLDIKLTGASEPVPYYLMYDRWEYVSDWVLLVLAPLEGVDRNIGQVFV